MTNEIAIRPIDKMNELARKNGMPEDKAAILLGEYSGVLRELEQYKPTLFEYIVTSEDDEVGMKKAGEAYKYLNGIFKKAEELRKEQKADAKRITDSVDGIGRILKAEIEPMLEHLKAQRDFKKNAEEARRIAQEKAEREELEKLRKEKERIHWENLQKQKAETEKALAEAASARKEAESLRAKIDQMPASQPTPPIQRKAESPQCTCPNCGYQFNPESGF